jgi:glycosyltransferase involved in cell wall biosynthesis
LNVDVIIPAYNEQDSIGLVLKDIPSTLVREVVVVNNNSTDNTAEVARSAGATVLDEPRPGYGSACLKGIDFVSKKDVKPDIVTFLDGDYSDHPEEMQKILEPLNDEKIDLVIGSRATGNREKGSMMPQQVFGNWLATRLMRLFYGVKYTDLGPFRAIRYAKLMGLGMVDTNYGWTVEMQVKAAKAHYVFAEVPVSYRKRVGVSKVSGTIKGTFMAGVKIIYTIFKYR